jgi:hypothetical protein
MKLFLFLVAIAVLVGPGCSTSKKVLNKATFGMVGAEEDDEAAAAAKAEAKEAKEQERAEKKRRKEEKKAEERARKQAEKEEPEVYVSEGKDRSWANTLTFGLVGSKDPDEKARKQAAREAEQEEKRARKAEKQARKAEKEAEERERKEAKRAEEEAKRQAKREQKAAEEAAKQAEREEEQASKEAEASRAEEQEGEKRGWASRLTFGLVGGKPETEEERAQREAAEAEKKAEKEAARQAKRERKEAADAQKDIPEPDEDMILEADTVSEEEVAVEEAAPADAVVSAEEVEPAEEAVPEEEPFLEREPEGEEEKPKRTLTSKLTFGLFGDKKGEDIPDDASAEAELSPKAARKAEKKEQKQLARAAEESRKEAIAALPAEVRKLGKLPFNTSVRDEEQWSGEMIRIADRESYSEDGYGICDVGDVRIAVEGMTFDGRWRTGRIVIDSSEEGEREGSSGIGNRRFTYKYSEGVSRCTFGSISFSIAECRLTIGGVDVPIGEGRHLVLVAPDGNVSGSYVIE